MKPLSKEEIECWPDDFLTDEELAIKYAQTFEYLNSLKDHIHKEIEAMIINNLKDCWSDYERED